MPDQPSKMRFYVEVTEAEARRFEKAGTAKVSAGASGGGGPHRDRQSPWCLLRTPALLAELAREVPSELTPKSMADPMRGEHLDGCRIGGTHAAPCRDINAVPIVVPE